MKTAPSKWFVPLLLAISFVLAASPTLLAEETNYVHHVGHS